MGSPFSRPFAPVETLQNLPYREPAAAIRAWRIRLKLYAAKFLDQREAQSQPLLYALFNFLPERDFLVIAYPVTETN